MLATRTPLVLRQGLVSTSANVYRASKVMANTAKQLTTATRNLHHAANLQTARERVQADTLVSVTEAFLETASRALKSTRVYSNLLLVMLEQNATILDLVTTSASV